MTHQTSELQRQLEERGFVVVEELISRDDIDAFDRRLEGLRHRRREEVEALSASGSRSFKRDFLGLVRPAAYEPFVLEFAKRTELTGLANTFLGPDVDLRLNEVVTKLPAGDLSLPWHQDAAYFGDLPQPIIAVWLALSDFDETNGCLEFLPGSHRRGRLRHSEGPFRLECHSLEDPDQGVALPVRAGTAVVIHPLTVHRSRTNRGDAAATDMMLLYAVGTDARFMRNDTGPIPVTRDGAAV